MAAPGEAIRGAHRPPCVIDARLALSTHGQLSIARLVREFPVWIPRQLHRVLRDTRSYLSQVNRLTPEPFCESLRQLDMEAEAIAIGRGALTVGPVT